GTSPNLWSTAAFIGICLPVILFLGNNTNPKRLQSQYCFLETFSTDDKNYPQNRGRHHSVQSVKYGEQMGLLGEISMVAGTEILLLHDGHQRVLDGEPQALQKPHLSTILVGAPILLMVGLYCLGTSLNIIIHSIALDTLGVDVKSVITRKERYGSGGKGTTYQ